MVHHVFSVLAGLRILREFVLTHLLDWAVEVFVCIQLGKVFDINTQFSCEYWQRLYGGVRI